MKRLLHLDSLKRGVAIALTLTWVTATLVVARPVRAADPTMAVAQFQSNVAVSGQVLDQLSTALYNGVQQTAGMSARGNGPLQLHPGVAQDPLGNILRDAAGAGAEHALVPTLIRIGGGSLIYRLDDYRVSPLGIVRTRVFTQNWPAVNNQALVAGFSSDVRTLEAGRAGTATIYDVAKGKIEADVGSAEGFGANERFNVIRNGSKVAEAVITTQYPDHGDLAIVNANSGYQAAVGDRLVSQTSQPPIVPPPPPANTGAWGPIGFIIGAAAVLIAIGQKGSVANFPTPSAIPSSTAGAFTVSGPLVIGGTTNLPLFEFIFSQPVSATSQTSIMGNTAFAFFTFKPSGGIVGAQQPLSALGPVTFTNASTLTIQDNNQPLTNAGDTLNFGFTSNILSVSSTPLTANTLSFVFDVVRRPLGAAPVAPKPVGGGAPGLPGGAGGHNPGGGKPPSGGKPPNPNNPNNPNIPQ